MTSVDPGEIQVGMHVIARDHEPVGRVKEVRAQDFLVDRPLQPDVYVPFRLVQNVVNDAIVLNTEAELLDHGDDQRFPLPGMP